MDEFIQECMRRSNRGMRVLSIFLITWVAAVVACVSGLQYCIGMLVGMSMFDSESPAFGIAGVAAFLVTIGVFLWGIQDAWLPMWWTALGQYERADADEW